MDRVAFFDQALLSYGSFYRTSSLFLDKKETYILDFDNFFVKN